MQIAELRHTRTLRTTLVEPELVIGRSALAGLQLVEPYVSAQHATLRWHGKSWQVKDLGSRNGTLLNGARLRAGQDYPLPRGSLLAFGHADETWEFTRDAAPRAMAIPLDGGDACLAIDDLLGLPSGDTPLASIHRDVDGSWRLEDDLGDVHVLSQHARFEIGGRTYRFSYPQSTQPTTTADDRHKLQHVALEFAVSRDEEHVELRALMAERTIDLGCRSHNSLLLTLARLRLRDLEAGQLESSAGWTFQTDVLKALLTTQMQLNIDVFRIRQHFARAGLHEVTNIVERRPRTKQLRIGVSQLRVRTL